MTKKIDENKVNASIKRFLLKEFEGQRNVIFKHTPSKLHGKGYPDFTASGNGKIFWLEAKKPGNKPTKLQRVMLIDLLKSTEGIPGVVVAWVDCDPEDHRVLKFHSPIDNSVFKEVRV